METNIGHASARPNLSWSCQEEELLARRQRYDLAVRCLSSRVSAMRSPTVHVSSRFWHQVPGGTRNDRTHLNTGISTLKGAKSVNNARALFSIPKSNEYIAFSRALRATKERTGHLPMKEV